MAVFQDKSQSVLGRGRVLQKKISELEMVAGGVLRADKRIKDQSYLTEMLTEQQRRSVMLPNSRKKNMWDALIAVLVSYTALMLPIQLCYDNVPSTLPSNLIIFDVFTDIVFICDVFLNFRVGYIEEASVVVDRAAIRRKYLSRWFFIDTIGSFPGDSIFFIIEAANAIDSQDLEGGSRGAQEGFGNREASLLTTFKMLKIPKLMRLGRLLKSLEKLEGAANVANIIILLVIMVVVNHWLSCLWFLITKGPNGWVAAQNLDELPWTAQYPETFYTTLMMVMGDSITPTNGVEYMISSLIVVIGITMNATVFASIASYAAQISADVAMHKNKMNSIVRSLKSLKLPEGLGNRIQQYYEYCWTRHRDFAQQVLIEELPAVFQRRCAMALHEAKLRRFGPFQSADERFVAALTTKLRPEVYMPEAYILVAGQVYSCAYFISRGLVQVTWPAESRDTVNVLSIDDYFGELSLFVTRKLAYTVRSETHLDAYRLERSDFMAVMKSYPAGAVHVADLMDSVLPAKLAKQVTREIYDYSGLREVLSALQTSGKKWRPPRGFADRLRQFAEEHAATLARIRTRTKGPAGGDNSIGAAPAMAGDGGGNGGGVSRKELAAVTRAQERLQLRVESGHTQIEARIDELTTLLKRSLGEPSSQAKSEPVTEI